MPRGSGFVKTHTLHSGVGPAGAGFARHPVIYILRPLCSGWSRGRGGVEIVGQGLQMASPTYC